MKRAIIIATGESLTQEDCDLALSLGTVYAVNDAYRLCPWADYLYACDLQWWDHHIKAVRETTEADLWTTDKEAADRHGLNHIPGHHHDDPNCRTPFDISGQGIVYGGNSGFQTLNLAYVHGHRDAILLGFDMGGSHFFGEHPPAIRNPSPWSDFLRNFQRAAPVIAAAGMRVRNATRGGALEAFPRVNLEDLEV